MSTLSAIIWTAIHFPIPSLLRRGSDVHYRNQLCEVSAGAKSNESIGRRTSEASAPLHITLHPLRSADSPHSKTPFSLCGGEKPIPQHFNHHVNTIAYADFFINVIFCFRFDVSFNFYPSAGTWFNVELVTWPLAHQLVSSFSPLGDVYFWETRKYYPKIWLKPFSTAQNATFRARLFTTVIQRSRVR